MANGLRRELAAPINRVARHPLSRGLRSSYEGIKAGLGGAEDLLGTAIGSQNLQQAGQRTFEENAQAAARDAPLVNDLTQIHDVNSFINYSLGKVGELVPFAASLAVGGGVGKAVAGEAGQFAGITGLSGAIQGGQTFEAAKAAGATPQQAVVPAAVSGLGQGALDAVLGAEFAKNLQGKVESVPGQAALGAGVNAAQVAAQQAAVTVAHPSTPLFTREHAKEIVNAAAAGGIAGGVLGGATRLIGGLRRSSAPSPDATQARRELLHAVQNAPQPAVEVPSDQSPDGVRALARANLSREDLLNLTTHEPGGRVFLNKTYTKLSTSEELAGKKFQGNSLSRSIEKLNNVNDGFSYEQVSLRRMVEERAAQKFSTQAERLTYLRDQAYKKFELATQKNPQFARLFNPAKPEDFLDRFVVIQKTPISSAIRPGTNLDLTKEDIANTLRTPRDAQDIRRGEIRVLDDGKPKRVNAMDLTIAGMKRTPATGATVTRSRVAEAFSTGLTSLLEKNPRTGTPTISLDGQIPDSTILFTSKRGEEITFGDIKKGEPGAQNTLIKSAIHRNRQAGVDLHYARKAELAKESFGRPEKVQGVEGTQKPEAPVFSKPTEAEKQTEINQNLDSQAAGVRATQSTDEARRIYKQATGLEPKKGDTRETLAARILAEKRTVSHGRVEPLKI